MPSTSTSCRTFFGPRPGIRSKSNTSAGTFPDNSSRSGSRPVSRIVPILAARSRPMPSRSVRDLVASALIASSDSIWSAMVRAAARYARTLNAFSPSYSRRSARRSKRTATSAFVTDDPGGGSLLRTRGEGSRGIGRGTGGNRLPRRGVGRRSQQAGEGPGGRPWPGARNRWHTGSHGAGSRRGRCGRNRHQPLGTGLGRLSGDLWSGRGLAGGRRVPRRRRCRGTAPGRSRSCGRCRRRDRPGLTDSGRLRQFRDRPQRRCGGECRRTDGLEPGPLLKRR